MAKKTRRARRKGAQPRLSKAQLIRPTDQETSLVAEAPAVEPDRVSVPQSKVTDFRGEYRYVVKDLQRIGILAAVMLGGLVVLSFLL